VNSSPQGVAHEDAYARLAAAGLRTRADGALEAPQGEGVGGESEICLGLAATGREEQQIDEGFTAGTTVRVSGLGERVDVQQDEGELERTPAGRRLALAVYLVVGLLVGPGIVLAPGTGGRDGCVAALQGHGPVGEPEGQQGRLVGHEPVDAEGDAVADLECLLDRGHGRFSQVLGE
jgi:hypothetical protein